MVSASAAHRHRPLSSIPVLTISLSDLDGIFTGGVYRNKACALMSLFWPTHARRPARGADLTFAPQLQRALHANVKSKSSTSNLILLVVLRF